MSKKTADSEDQDENLEQLKLQNKSLTCELLKERIARIDFQVQLLTQWRQQCQQELNRSLSSAESFQNSEG